MIIIIGSFIAQESRFAEALKLSQEHVERSRAETGCISHAMHQDFENPFRLVFIEEWSDQASLQQHFKVPASKEFASALAILAIEPPKMAIYEATKLT